MGHEPAQVTETVYRHVIVLAIRGEVAVMDDVFGDDDPDEHNQKAKNA